MSNKNIKMDGRYRYRNGEPARILCIDAPCDECVVSLTSKGWTLFHDEYGRRYVGENNEWDLIEVKEEKTVEFWVNIYSDRGPSFHAFRTYADEFAGLSRIACKKGVITYREGDEE